MSVAGPPPDAKYSPSGGSAATIAASVGAHPIEPPSGPADADAASTVAPPAAARERLKSLVVPLVPRALSKGWVRGDVTGGLAAATANLTLALALGLLAFAPLGPQYAGIGVLAGFASAIYGHVVAGLLGGAAHPGSGPRASTSLILGGLVALLAADPALAPSATRGPELIVALAGAAVVIAGVLQMVLGSLGGGAFARYVPYPFVAGFMCGVSALIMITQSAPLAGATRADFLAGPATALLAVQPATLFVGLATLAMSRVFASYSKRVPSLLAGLAAGTLLYYLVHLLFPDFRLGPVIGALSGLPLPTALIPLTDMPLSLVIPHAVEVAMAAWVIALIGTLDGLFAAVAIDHATGGRHRTKREVVAHGLANVVSGLCGGVPVVLSQRIVLASWEAGARSRRTTVVAAALLAFALVFGARLVAVVPVTVLAGIMMMLGIGLIDNWTRGLVRRLRRPGALRDATLLWSVATVALVALAAVFFGFISAIGVGLQLSAILFFRGMNRSLVRSVVDGTVRPSRRVWGGDDAVRIAEVRRRIRVIELEGALFYGSAERLSERVEPLGGEVDAVVLDFRRVTVIDATGALLLERLARRLATSGTKLLLASVTAGGRHGPALLAHGVFQDVESRLWFRDADQAVEWAEHAALESIARAESAELPLSVFPLMEGLSAGRLARIAHYFARRTFASGEVLFQENDPGDRLCLLASGAVEISIVVPGGSRARLVTMEEGSLFGEAALLDGRPRSATAQAVEDTVVYELTRDALDEIATRDPAIAIRLMTNLARILSLRMRETNEILRQLDDSRG
jgi:MFS superfamily sulfate permease-like transporter/CRP-like cAMP-binding protein